VLPRGKKFNALRSRLGEDIKKTGMQALAQEYVCGDDLQHRLFRKSPALSSHPPSHLQIAAVLAVLARG
jgi:hypothetical protein